MTRTKEFDPKSGGQKNRRFRLIVARRSSRAISSLCRTRIGFALVRVLRRIRLTSSLLDAFVGYQRLFGTLEEAERCGKRYLSGSHEHSDAARVHLALGERARPSDYPALFYLSRIIRDGLSIFDFGGNVGNLYYCYRQYLNFPAGLRWTVFDIPAITAMGAEIAEQRKEAGLQFTNSFAEADGADVFLASGCVHYFEESIAEMVRRLTRKPAHIIINRSPLTEKEPVITVQDSFTYLTACKLHNKAELVRECRGLGYDLVDSWSAPELSLSIPCYPDLSVRAYSGLYFRCTAGS